MTLSRYRRQRGNFLVASALVIILLVMGFVIIRDVLTRQTYEEELQKLADDTALHTAAMVPSVQIPSYLVSSEIKGWMTEQGYQVGDHVLSVANAQAVDQYAQARAAEYMSRNAITNAASNYFGGNVVMTVARPKFTARREGNKQIIDYYVEIELHTKCGSAILDANQDVVATAVAKATIDYESFFSISEPNPDSPTVNPVFANGVYAKEDVTFTNSKKVLYIDGDVHANEQVVTFQNDNIVNITGSVSAGLNVAIKNTDSMTVAGDVLTGDSSPDLDMPPMVYPTGVNDPNFTHPIIIIDGDYTMTGSFPPAGDPRFHVGGVITGDTITSGTLYVRNGSLHLNKSSGGSAATDANISGDWCFVVTNDVHFNNFGVNATSKDTTNELFFMIGGTVHLNNLKASSPVTLNGCIYANSGIHINNDGPPNAPMTILGGVYSNTDVYFNNMAQNLSIIHKPTPNVMPEPWTEYLTMVISPPVFSSPRVVLLH